MSSIKSSKNKTDFSSRHIGARPTDIQQMLKTLNCKTLKELIQKVTPTEILNCKKLNLPKATSEFEILKKLKTHSKKNKIFKNYIGMGYYETILPPVIQRNILENPVWLTSYTPYQSEIAQGRLQALLNFQTMITELTQMEVANASLLDEGTATAEAVTMAFNNKYDTTANTVFIDEHIFPQTKEVLKTRAKSLGFSFVIGSAKNFDFNKNNFCTVIQYPDSTGGIYDWKSFCKKAQQKNIITIFIADPISLCLLKTPGSMGADIVTGSCQRMGIPLFLGGPHAAYIATKTKYVKSLPGRIIGMSKDRHNKPALRLAIQTREQHIRREKATSNICTAQALLAVLSSMFAMYHGPEGLKQIATSINLLTLSFAQSLNKMGFTLTHLTNIFDTVQIELSPQNEQNIYNLMLKNKINVAKTSLLYPTHKTVKNIISISINETTTKKDIQKLLTIFLTVAPQKNVIALNKLTKNVNTSINQQLLRTSPCLQHPLFKTYHCETTMLRYIHKLQAQDISLTHSMIPLGSCTMKLNATTELLPVTWPEFSNIHPFSPPEQITGYTQLIAELETYLCEITGFSGISFQPNAGSQGEYTGLLIIRRYHESQKNMHKKICLIPSSAHGTNPASAVMAGFTPITIKCDKQGNISHEDLKQKIQKHKKELGAFMLTFPSTFGVFEQGIPQICEWIHNAGGLVYLDGANMNSLIGISKVAQWGADVCHLNLHKTFCIPHGGGGPGVGPVAVTNTLKKFLPSHCMVLSKSKNALSAISSAPWGSAGILVIPWIYIRLMGAKGLTKATEVAILNANYIAQKLSKYYKILYTGKNNKVAHECIVDFRKFRNTSEVTVNDVAKRLIDYGFHAPTVSWPIPGTLMAEPTESENKDELDRFCSALIEIRKEIQEIEDKKFNINNNVLKNAPHNLEDALQKNWDFPYSKTKAFYPLPWVKENKFWPKVSRVADAYGDINLFCSCPPIHNI